MNAQPSAVRRVLIVEDNEMNSDMLSRRLRRHGYEPVVAADGQAGLECARQESPDIILLDLTLPVIDGWEVARQLKRDPQTQAIPIIALTAHAMTGDRDKAIEAGCDDYDTKPVDLPRLLSKMQALLASSPSVVSVAEGAAPTGTSTEATGGRSPHGLGGTVLIVDDVAENRDLLARRVRREGCDVRTACNGEEALAILDRGGIDLVLLDIMMPVVNGYEVLERMKADTALRHVPVIVISATDELSSVVKCLEMGANDYLSKPFNSVILKARMAACLLQKRLRDQEVQYRQQLEAEKTRADGLLHALFPHPVVQELKATNAFRPRRYQDVAVLLCDIVGFTSYCDRRPPEEVVPYLQRLIETFEELAARHGLEKIKTIGDAFMATAGLLTSVENPVLRCVQCGQEMIAAAHDLSPHWEVRVGIHFGPVVAGVVGSRQYCFDIWGDTVNTAARVESHGTPGAVNISGAAWQQIAHRARGESRMIEVKGKGPLEIVRFKQFISS